MGFEQTLCCKEQDIEVCLLTIYSVLWEVLPKSYVVVLTVRLELSLEGSVRFHISASNIYF